MMKINVKGTIIPNDDQWIYDLFDIDATSPAKVSKGITAAAEKGEPLEVYINSGGGDILQRPKSIRQSVNIQAMSKYTLSALRQVRQV